MNFDLPLLGFEDKFLDELLNIDIEMPDLASGDKSAFQKKTFSLHDEQAAVVEEALTKAKHIPSIDTGLNDNSNGNAITYICEQWLKQNG